MFFVESGQDSREKNLLSCLKNDPEIAETEVIREGEAVKLYYWDGYWPSEWLQDLFRQWWGGASFPEEQSLSPEAALLSLWRGGILLVPKTGGVFLLSPRRPAFFRKKISPTVGSAGDRKFS